MSKLVWDATGEREYETGVKQGVLYVMGDSGSYGNGVAWNGLTSVSENPSGAEKTPLYADDIKYLNLMSAEDFGATIEAYTYPDEFMKCDGTAEIGTGVYAGQQNRTAFAMVYVTTMGNDVKGNSYGEKIHIIYNALASPSAKQYSTINDSPEAITFSWEVTTTPIEAGDGLKPTATIVIDSTKVAADKLTAIKDALFGTESTEPKVLLPKEIATLLAAA